MKKIFATILTIVMLFSACIAVADEIELNKDTTSATTIVSLTVDRTLDSYQFMIPSQVTIDPVTLKGTLTVTLKAGWTLIATNAVHLKVKDFQNEPSDEMGDYSTFFMKDNSTGKSCYYCISTYDFSWGENGWSNIPMKVGTLKNTNIVKILRGDDNTSDKVGRLYLATNHLPEPGVYTDGITFEITVE